LNKQVGFFWSLSWPIECLLLYPALFLLIGYLVSFWKREAQGMAEPKEHLDSWNGLINSLRLPFWVAAIVAFVLVFAVQWGGVYLLGLLQDGAPALVDWILVARLRPNVVSFEGALLVSLFAFLFSGLIYWFYFAGLLLIFAVSEDFSRQANFADLDVDRHNLAVAGAKLRSVIFKCTIIGILAATAIQLNAIYLKSDSETSLAWLAYDSLAGLSFDVKKWALMDQSSISSLTSSILLLLHLALFAVCTAKIRASNRTFGRRGFGGDRSQDNDSHEARGAIRDPLVRQVCILGILCLNFALLGQFVGFTLLLFASLLVAVAGIYWPQKDAELFLRAVKHVQDGNDS
jgi:hypothetical protein